MEESKDNLFRVAFIAHNGKKKEMMKFIMIHEKTIKEGCDLCVATSTTGKDLEELGFNVKRYLSGPMGGDAQIASRVAEGKIGMVIFFRDHHTAHPHDADIAMLVRNCDVHNVPLATNQATAEFLIKTLKNRNN